MKNDNVAEKIQELNKLLKERKSLINKKSKLLATKKCYLEDFEITLDKDSLTALRKQIEESQKKNNDRMIYLCRELADQLDK